MRNFLICLFTIFALLFCNSAFANDYTIDRYHIDINVHENNILDITEEISAYFNVSKHGIFRTIPRKNFIHRHDGSKAVIKAKLTNLQVSEQFTFSKNSQNYKIKIGHPKRVIVGKKNYALSYSYNLGNDIGQDYDELYFNIIGPDWDTSIDNISFSIVMPKPFDTSKLNFAAGTLYSTENNGVHYKVDGNTIKGYYDKRLNPTEALTVRLELPEGYFIKQNNSPDIINLLILIIPIVFAMLSFSMWFLYGKDDDVIETVEFYPPKGLNSAEVGLLYRERASQKEVVSLLIYLANKGYINIVETGRPGLIKNTCGFKLQKIKSYDGTNKAEALLMHKLFATKDEINDVELQKDFYITVMNVIDKINESKKYLFEDLNGNIFIGIIIYLMAVVSIFISCAKSIFENSNDLGLLFVLLFPILAITVIVYGSRNTESLSNKLFIIIWGILFGSIPYTFVILPGIMEDNFLAVAHIIGFICAVIMMICSSNMPRKSQYGNIIYSKIKGFKRFIKLAEKQELEAFVYKDPTYFYDILPYAYVLDVSDKWIKKFESITMPPPEWYEGTHRFTAVSFGAFMSSTIDSISSVSSPPSSSGSGSFSGGGSGGGGGGSW